MDRNHARQDRSLSQDRGFRGMKLSSRRSTVFRASIAAVLAGLLAPAGVGANFGPYYAEGSHHTFIDVFLETHWPDQSDWAREKLAATVMSAAWVDYRSE